MNVDGVHVVGIFWSRPVVVFLKLAHFLISFYKHLIDTVTMYDEDTSEDVSDKSVDVI